MYYGTNGFQRVLVECISKAIKFIYYSIVNGHWGRFPVWDYHE